ncbi:hypothetical protein [Candidatus Pristimantibacillus sp. PTI5]|uniref:hypothetical protein n=1 Tax=Candidatus Pristimantibacillus sp. PTI5 TaxID=3400422 RepID=UPI003B027431
MNRDFLYSKPIIPGIIDDTPVDLESWFFDNSWELMKKKFKVIPLDELIQEIVEIFGGGDPDYQSLFGLFGSGLLKDSSDWKTVYRVREIDRANNDIKMIEMHVDNESLSITNFCIFLENMKLIQTVKNRIPDQKKIRDLTNGLEISAGESIITVMSV